MMIPLGLLYMVIALFLCLRDMYVVRVIGVLMAVGGGLLYRIGSVGAMTEDDARMIAELLEQRDELEALRKALTPKRKFFICATSDGDDLFESMTLPLADGCAFVEMKLKHNRAALHSLGVEL